VPESVHDIYTISIRQIDQFLSLALDLSLIEHRFDILGEANFYRSGERLDEKKIMRGALKFLKSSTDIQYMRQWSSSLIILGVVLLVLGFSRSALADAVVKSDFVFQLDNSIFDDPKLDFLSRLQGHEEINMNDTLIQGEVPATVHGIHASMDYKLKASSRQIVLGAEQALESDTLNVNLLIDQIAVDTIVRRMVGGVLIEARVQGTCTAIPMSLSAGKAKVVGALKAALISMAFRH
jgi:hypothetical protein